MSSRPNGFASLAMTVQATFYIKKYFTEENRQKSRLKVMWSEYGAKTGCIFRKLNLIMIRREELKANRFAGFALLCVCLVFPALDGKANTKA